MKTTINQNLECKREFEVRVNNLTYITKCQQICDLINKNQSEWSADYMGIWFRHKTIFMIYSYFGDEKNLHFHKKLSKQLNNIIQEYESNLHA